MLSYYTDDLTDFCDLRCKCTFILINHPGLFFEFSRTMQYVNLDTKLSQFYLLNNL